MKSNDLSSRLSVSNSQRPMSDNFTQLQQMAYNAQLLIQLQIRQKLESQFALEEFTKIKEAIQSLPDLKIQAIIKQTKALKLQAKTLVNLVNDLLDYAKFENGNFVFFEEVFDLAGLIKENSFITLQFMAEEKNVSLEYFVSLELAQGPIVEKYDFSMINKKSGNNQNSQQNSENQDFGLQSKKTQRLIDKLFLKRIIGDERRYLQILLNFLSNAIKFTKNKGSVFVNLKITSLQISCSEGKELNSSVAQNTVKLIQSQQNLVESQEQQEQLDDQKLEIVLNLIRSKRSQQMEKVSEESQVEIQNKSLNNSDSNLNKQDQNLSLKSKNLSHQNSVKQEGLNQQNPLNLNDQKPQDEEDDLVNCSIGFVIEVADTGIGIQKENLSKLFMEFNKLDEQSKMNRQGTGLGLTISKKMVKQMGGDITVQSEFKQGTSFFISLTSQTLVPKIELSKFLIDKQSIQLSKVSNQSQNVDFTLDPMSLVQNSPIQIQKKSSDIQIGTHNPEIRQKILQFKKDRRLSSEQANPFSDQSSLDENIIYINLQNLSQSFQLSQKENQSKQLNNSQLSDSQSQNKSESAPSYSNNDIKLQTNQKIVQESQLLKELLRDSLNQKQQQFVSYVSFRPKATLQSHLSLAEINQNNQFFSPQLHQNLKDLNIKVPNSGCKILKKYSESRKKEVDEPKKEVSDQSFKIKNDQIGSSSKQIPNLPLNQPLFQFQLQSNDEENQIDYSGSFNLPSEEEEKSPQAENLNKVYPQRLSSLLSPSYLYSLKEQYVYENLKDDNQVQFKVLIANDECYQLTFLTLIFQKHNFKVNKAENGMVAFHKVRKFIENYNLVRSFLQKPDSCYKNLTQDGMETIMSTLVNYDLIILDLNMPVMDGFLACKKINELYNSFNALSDFDDEINEKENFHQQKIDELYVLDLLGEEHDESDDNLQLDKVLKSSYKKQVADVKTQQKHLKQIYDFKTQFNHMLHIKPLIVAVSANVNDQIITQAMACGFDKVIEAPLRQDTVLNVFIPEIKLKYKQAQKIHFLKKKSKSMMFPLITNNISLEILNQNGQLIQKRDSSLNQFKIPDNVINSLINNNN